MSVRNTYVFSGHLLSNASRCQPHWEEHAEQAVHKRVQCETPGTRDLSSPMGCGLLSLKDWDQGRESLLVEHDSV